MHRITLTINGEVEQLDVPANMTLLQMLREKLALTGTKNGCSAGECGASTVMLDGEPVNSCMVLAVECDGADVLTVEGLARDGVLDPIQETIIDKGGVQCGFCTPGMLISSRALLNRNPHPTDEDIRLALVGNLCRCTGYVRIIAAVQAAAQREAAKHAPQADEAIHPVAAD
ncbi:MAG TPA: (2Fe-2S)-binding protein [Anaerolineaceae bacterium]|nr:(2Fe-2S)-binding protein [Anaerolineaceae bacterium]